MRSRLLLLIAYGTQCVSGLQFPSQRNTLRPRSMQSSGGISGRALHTTSHDRSASLPQGGEREAHCLYISLISFAYTFCLDLSFFPFYLSCLSFSLSLCLSISINNVVEPHARDFLLRIHDYFKLSEPCSEGLVAALSGVSICLGEFPCMRKKQRGT
jgi:hypothetical protein